MKIKKITWQHRRDFSAIMECEFCHHEIELKSGYDDEHYHRNVIPNMKCPKCDQSNHESYRPLTTKYPEGFQV